MSDQYNSVSRRAFALGAVFGLGAPLLTEGVAHAQAESSGESLGFILDDTQMNKAATTLARIWTPFLGEWVGTRDGKDTGVDGEVVLRKNYSLLAGGPSVLADVEAFADGVSVFKAAKAYAYSPEKDTLLTYFFESGGHVQIFELDPKELDNGVLAWQEVSRKGRLFRAEETVPEDDEFVSRILQQNENGVYDTFAENILRRPWKNAVIKKRGGGR